MWSGGEPETKVSSVAHLELWSCTYICPRALGCVETSQALLALRQPCDLDSRLRKEWG